MPAPARLLALLAAATVLAGCAAHGGAAPADTSLDIATTTLLTSFDTEDATAGTLPYFQAVYDTLVKREPDGALSPMLATGWAYDAARTTLTLTLRTGVRFDDGTPFDASAVKANLDHLRRGDGAAAGALARVEAVEVVDATRVRLVLPEPDPGLLNSLGGPAGLVAAPAGLPGEGLRIEPSGTGPYELDQARTVAGYTWVFTRAAGYWGARLPYDTITFSYLPDESAIVTGLTAGRFDATLLRDPAQQLAVRNDPSFSTVEQVADLQGLMLFDRAGAVAPELKDPRVRRALNYAVDRPTLLSKLRQGRGQVTGQVFGPGTAGYRPELDTYYALNRARARALLAEAGLANGFTLRLPRDPSVVSPALASLLRNDLGAVGVEVVWEPLDHGSAQRRILLEQAYPGLVMTLRQSSDDWAVLRELVLPGRLNPAGYTDATVRRLLPKLRDKPAEADLEALNRHLVEDGWFVPFFRMTYLHVSDGTVTISPQDGMAAPSLYGYAPAR
ncbi:ABC transporter substrate-binding protein [Nonomuraea maheshkhaliensis]|uniref:ABC transporter substrate-binding protein n=1 Tax=Nonomuraea maheshkhaliensis TaxID=419590 RepID=A0ABN2F7P4_9ACTN